ncbi:ACT domain-containing protein, partial [Aetokthonos hydrillicola]
CNYQSQEDLLAALGYGEITLNRVLSSWREIVKAQQTTVVSNEQALQAYTPQVLQTTTPTRSSFDSPMIGVEGLGYHLAACCHPIPGEPIIGVVTRGKGIKIHRQGCHHLANVKCIHLVPVSWKSTAETTAENNGHPQTYPVNVQIEALDRVGVLKDILSRLSDQGINVRHAHVKTTLGQPALIDLGIDIRDRSQLEQVFTKINKLSDILNIRRVDQMDD